MTFMVLDASVAVAWICSSQSNGETRRLLRESDAHDFIAPSIFPFEVRNGVLKLERRGLQQAEETDRAWERLDDLNLDVMAPLDERALDGVMMTARRGAMSLFDAAYLDLASKAQCPLASRDRKLLAMAAAFGIGFIDLRGPPA